MQNTPFIYPNMTTQYPQQQTAIQPQAVVNNTAPQPVQNTAAVAVPAQSPTYAYPANYYMPQPALTTPQGQVVQTAPQAPNTQGVTTPTSGVNIMIFNPSVSTPGGNVTHANNYFQNTPPAPVQPVIQQIPPQQPSANSLAASTVKTEVPKAEEKKYKKEVVQLTDEYIKSLENYLNNSSQEIRKMGATELLKRFEEDSSRKNDIALTNLLNKALQDPNSSVRMLALSAINSGSAQGDNLTTQILTNIAQSKNAYGFDAELAASAALKRVGKTVEIETTTPPKGKSKETAQA